MMEIKELREKEKSELVKLLKEARLELVKLRLERKVGSLSDGSTITKKRKELARILTALKEKEILREVTKTIPPAKVSKRMSKEKSKSQQKEGQNAKKKA